MEVKYNQYCRYIFRGDRRCFQASGPGGTMISPRCRLFGRLRKKPS